MKKLKNYILDSWHKSETHKKIILIGSLSYLLVISAYMVWHQVFFSPDRFFLFALLAAVGMGKGLTFLGDWTPPILLIMGYEYLRGLVPNLTERVHVFPMINFDRLLFHTLPTTFLQSHLFTGQIRWYDILAVVLYFLHFIIPLVVAFMFWVIDRQFFKKYMMAMVTVSYLAFLTYFIFPAMPPWMASQKGYIAPVQHIMDLVLAHFGHSLSLPTLYSYVGANLVAAVPSLHAAYPLMTALFIWKKFPKYGKLSFIYPLLMWFAVVYLAEHYVFDVLIAIIYVFFVYKIVQYSGAIREKVKLFLNERFEIISKDKLSDNVDTAS